MTRNTKYIQAPSILNFLKIIFYGKINLFQSAWSTMAAVTSEGIYRGTTAKRGVNAAGILKFLSNTWPSLAEVWKWNRRDHSQFSVVPPIFMTHMKWMTFCYCYNLTLVYCTFPSITNRRISIKPLQLSLANKTLEFTGLWIM